jgi:regulator of sigma E protease
VTALYIIPILAILILAHEAGHFLTARLVGIKVEEFGIGFPPRLFGFRRGGVLYSINLIPIGGFVRVLGEDGKSFAPDSMQAKPRLQRALFISAGSLMNFLLAILLSMVLIGAQGITTTNVYIAGVEPNSPAQQAGWETGDRIVEVAGKPLTSAAGILGVTRNYAGRPMPVTMIRDGQLIHTEVTPRKDPPAGQGPTGSQVVGAPPATITVSSIDPGSNAEKAGLQTGDVLVRIGREPIVDGSAYALELRKNAGQTVPVTVDRGGQEVTVELAVPAAAADATRGTTGVTMHEAIRYQSVPWWQILPRGLADTGNIIKQMFQGLSMLIRGDAPLSGVAGPIGMGQLTSEVLATSAAPVWATLANIMILLSLNLAILNLLPIPALDGGRLLFVIIEFIRGKRVAPEKESLVHLVGLAILLAFMFVVAFVDIDRLASGQSFLH